MVGGLPGTGKTTLGRALATSLAAVYLRADVVETPLLGAGIEVGSLGYEIVRELALSNLQLGAQVVVDLVNPWPITRMIWSDLASELDVPLIAFECVIPDEAEHRRRVEARVPDLPGQVVPLWADVVSREYLPWDEARDGPLVRVDMTETDAGLRDALAALE